MECVHTAASGRVINQKGQGSSQIGAGQTGQDCRARAGQQLTQGRADKAVLQGRGRTATGSGQGTKAGQGRAGQ